MELVDGISHVATVTDDLDRMVAFYQRVSTPSDRQVMEEDGLRHVSYLTWRARRAPPLRGAVDDGDERREMFERGRIDHFGVTVRPWTRCSRSGTVSLAEGDGVTDAQIRDFGALYSLHYVDPDGVHLEVNLFKDDWTNLQMLDRKDWTVARGQSDRVVTSRKTAQVPGTPRRTCSPTSSKLWAVPVTAIGTEAVTKTSPGPAIAVTRAAMWTAIPATSAPRRSTSPTWTPIRTCTSDAERRAWIDSAALSARSVDGKVASTPSPVLLITVPRCAPPPRRSFCRGGRAVPSSGHRRGRWRARSNRRCR